MPARKRFWGCLGLFTSLTFCSCASLGSYTWYKDVPQAEWSNAPSEYVVGAGDTLTVRVYEQDNLATRVKIRNDGRMAMPLVGEVVAAGKTPVVLSRELEAKLKVFIVTPRVTVNVDETVPITVSVLGEVANPGMLSLEQPAGVLQAIAKAGGLTEYADKEAIFVMRQKPLFRRIRFSYDALLTNRDRAAVFPVRSGDVIAVQ